VYPNLTPTLVVLLAIAFAAVAYLALRQSFLRRLALRQVSRRRREASLVILGSMLGTAIVVGSLIVGDTLNFSVKQAAYENLGPIDESVMSTSVAQGRAVAARLATLRTNPAVDGLLNANAGIAAVSDGARQRQFAEPRAAVWDLDFSRAAAFGAAGAGGSGLSGPAPPPGWVVLNRDLATVLHAREGDPLTFYAFGREVVARVSRVVPTRGVAGMPIDGITKDAFFAPGTLAAVARDAGIPADAPGLGPRSFTFVSNAGGVEAGAALSERVARDIRGALGPLAAGGTSIDTIKKTVLDQAKQTGDSLGSLFLMIGVFAIIAGILLLVNIFVMLAEERKPELGMLRAVGMKRSRLIRAFVIEGSVYALLASLLGVLVGIAVGRGVVVLAARIFSGFDTGGSALHIVYHVSTVSLVNGFAIGLLIALATVVLTSVRISRINVIAAIRDLPPVEGSRMKPWRVVASTCLAVVFAVLSVGALAADSGPGTYLYPPLVALFLIPALLRLWPKRWVYTGAAGAIILWTLIANTLRPHVLDTNANVSFILMGVILTFSAVVLISQNQEVVARPLRPLMDRGTQLGLSTRLAVAYPLGRRFRTGAILIMYGLVVFTLVFITILAGLVGNTVTQQVKSASGGYAIRVDFNPAAPIPQPASTLTSGAFAGRITSVDPLYAALGKVDHVSVLVPKGLDAVVVGTDASITGAGGFALAKRAPAFGSDAAAWNAVMDDPRYVIVDNMLGQLSGGGPPKDFLRPGQTITLTDPTTGKTEQKILAGTLDSAFAFYGMGGGLLSPVVESLGAARAQFGANLQPAAALVRPAPGVSPEALVEQLQTHFLVQGLVATRIRQSVEQNFSANRGFFQLMQGFIALGLLVGVAGLGVVMIRAVRERRRSIGVLRALGFQSRTVQRAFLTESLFVTLEGVVIGAGLSIVTSYMLFKNYAFFRDAGGFSVPWTSVAILVVAATVASVLATLWPARQASRIRPAVALRMGE